MANKIPENSLGKFQTLPTSDSSNSKELDSRTHAAAMATFPLGKSGDSTVVSNEINRGEDSLPDEDKWMKGIFESQEFFLSENYSGNNLELRKQILMSSKSRKEKIPQEIKNQCEELTRDLDEIFPLYLKVVYLRIKEIKIGHTHEQKQKNLENKLKKVNNQSSNIENNEKDVIENLEKQLEENAKCIEDIEKEIQLKKQKLLSKYECLLISDSSFWNWNVLLSGDREDSTSESNGIQLIFLKEQFLNRCINNYLYLRDVKKFIQDEKRNIVIGFWWGDKELEVEKYIESIDFKIEKTGLVHNRGRSLTDTETHNHGKAPLKVIFFREKEEIFTVYYKPRDSRIDFEVVELFNKLNQVNDPSNNAKFFIYTIIQKTISESPCSLWENVSGVKGKGYTPSDGVKADSETAKILLKLEAVCKYLEISDLSTDNVIFHSVIGEEDIPVPIDLESLQPGSETGLYRSSPPIQFSWTPMEKRLLDECKKKIHQLPHRFVPIATTQYTATISNFASCKQLKEVTCQSIQHSGFTLTCTGEEVERLILGDFLNNDVPYLAICNSKLYYGPFHLGIQIGEKNEFTNRHE